MAARRASSGSPQASPSAESAGDAAAQAAGGASALSFEQALEKLESLVDRLERGDLPLEEALSAFEEGVALTRRCAGQLDDAERRIEMLTREGEGVVARPFEPPEETD
jgi:exodeoxyribonuclease VII small subunit